MIQFKNIDVLKYRSGHKSLESFKIYLHPSKTDLTLGEQRSTQVADLVRNFSERLANERHAEQPGGTIF